MNFDPVFWVLDGETPRQTGDVVEWGQWFETGERLLWCSGNEVVFVSTVFLGIDHNFSGVGRPILFETLVFGGPYHGDGDRYCTYAEAAHGHELWAHRVFPALAPA